MHRWDRNTRELVIAPRTVAAPRKLPMGQRSSNEVALRGERLLKGALEGAITDVLWEDDGWMLPAEVHAKFPAERNLHYTAAGRLH